MVVRVRGVTRKTKPPEYTAECMRAGGQCTAERINLLPLRQYRVPEKFHIGVDHKQFNIPLFEGGLINAVHLLCNSLPFGSARRPSRVPKSGTAGRHSLPGDRELAKILYLYNFRVILLWNRSNFFAIAVGTLADRIAEAKPKQKRSKP